MCRVVVVVSSCTIKQRSLIIAHSFSTAHCSFTRSLTHRVGLALNNRNKAKIVIVLLSLLDFLLAAAMALLGVTSLLEMSFSIDNLSAAFLSAYMIIFASLLFVYELVWWQPFPALNKNFRKNFGFMYGLRGKGLYLIFIAFLCLGMYKNEDKELFFTGLDWMTGLAWLAGGAAHVLMGCCIPDINDTYKPATAGLEGDSGDNNNVV